MCRSPVGLPLTGHTNVVTSVTFLPDGQIVSGSWDQTIRVWTSSSPRKWPKPSQQITAIHLSRHPASSVDKISLEGYPHVVSACLSPDRSLYAASTLDGHISIWNTDRKLLWETKISIHPIHFLQFSESQLVLSTPNGSTLSWDLVDGKPANKEAITRRPQPNRRDIHGSTASASDLVTWFPFSSGAGLWAYVDQCFIRFEGEESVTIIDVGELDG